MDRLNRWCVHASDGAQSKFTFCAVPLRGVSLEARRAFDLRKYLEFADSKTLRVLSSKRGGKEHSLSIRWTNHGGQKERQWKPLENHKICSLLWGCCIRAFNPKTAFSRHVISLIGDTTGRRVPIRFQPSSSSSFKCQV